MNKDRLRFEGHRLHLDTKSLEYSVIQNKENKKLYRVSTPKGLSENHYSLSRAKQHCMDQYLFHQLYNLEHGL